MEERRIMVSGSDARKVIKSAVNKVANVVRATLGPSGRNVLLTRGHRMPWITNDGVRIAKNIHLDDELEMIVARQFVDVADQTNQKAGDGTTTSIVLGQKIINTGIDKIEIGGDLVASTESVMDTQKEIMRSTQEAIKLLKEVAKPVDKLEDLVKVAVVSVEDQELAKEVAKLIMEVGPDAFVSVEEGYKERIESEVLKGMRVDAKYGDGIFVNTNKQQMFVSEPNILLTNEEITADMLKNELADFIKKYSTTHSRELTIIAPKFEKEALIAMAQTQQAQFFFYPVKIPALTTEQIEDLAVYLDATFFNKNTGMSIATATKADLGRADTLTCDFEYMTLVGGRGKDKVADRIKKIKEEKKEEKDPMFKGKMDIRIGSLASSVGVIRVGSVSEAEKGYLKLKLEDAVFASRCALEEGIVEGGGIALKKVAEKLGKDNILYEALQSPYEQIQNNAGGNLKIGKDIVDPVKVTRTALEQASSVAGMLLTTDTIIADKNVDNVAEELVKLLKQDNG